MPTSGALPSIGPAAASAARTAAPRSLPAFRPSDGGAAHEGYPSLTSVVKTPTATAQEATCSTISVRTAAAVVPGIEPESRSKRSGTSEIRSTTSATLLNIRAGRRRNLAIRPNTTTAPVIPTTVKNTVGPTPSGKKPSPIPRTVPATVRITTFTTLARATVMTPTRANRPIEIPPPATPPPDKAATTASSPARPDTRRIRHHVIIHNNIDYYERQR